MPANYLQPRPPNPFEASARSKESLSDAGILDLVAERGVNIQNPEATQRWLGVLREEFGIDDEAFTDFQRSITLCAIAERLASNETAGIPASDYSSELEYAADLVMDIAGQYTVYKDSYESSKPADESKMELTDERITSVVDKYYQPELSRGLQAFIQGEDMAELRQRLGGGGQPFEVKVLTIDTGDTFGLVPQVKFESGLDSKQLSDLESEQKIRNNYLQGLKTRGRQFSEELGLDKGISAPAWVWTLDNGQQLLCVSSPLAERIIYPDEERSTHLTESDRERDLATLKHEYIHTQQNLSRGRPGLGVALEELRAEHFSGDKHGYNDIKRYFLGMKILTGYSPVASFEVEGQPYDRDECLADMARHLGLAGMLDSLAVIPQAYEKREDVSVFVKSAIEQTGGLSGQFQKLYERLVMQAGEDVIEDRVSKAVDSLLSSPAFKDGSLTFKNWMDYVNIGSLNEILFKNYSRRYGPQEP